MADPQTGTPTPRPQGRQQPAALSKKGLQRLQKKRAAAEAFINEPLTVYVRRALRNGRTHEEIIHTIEGRTRCWASFSQSEIRWLAQHPDPVVFERPDKPRSTPAEARQGGSPQGFWASVAAQTHVRAVGGGLPGMGKRR